jgi:HEPN domain-containing protein
MDSSLFLWIIGFHVQQTVEKSLKAVLTYNGIQYPFTHDITALINLVRKSGLPLPPEHCNLHILTPFAARFRYEDEDIEPPVGLTTESIIKWATTTLAWAQSYCVEAKQS